MNGHPDNETADQVDEHNDDAGDGVAFDKFARTVHRAVEVGFPLDFFPPLSRLLLVDHAGVQIGVDTHLFAGHRIERKSCANFGDPFRPFRDDDKLHNDQDEEHNETDRNLSAGDEIAERIDDVSRIGIRSESFASSKRSAQVGTAS